MRNFISLSFAQVLTRLLGFIVTVYVAKKLGPANFGVLSLAQAVLTYFLITTDLGLKTWATGEVASPWSHVQTLADQVFSLRLLLGTLSFIILLFFLPKSPRWLAEKGRFDQAKKVLIYVEGADYAEKEMAEIKTSLSGEKGTFAELFRPGLRMALVIGLLLAVFNNWSGWSGAGGYLVYLLEKAGVSNKSEGILQLLIAYGVMGVFTMLACFLVDRFGRKPLWNFSAALMAVLMFLVGMVFHYNITGIIVLVIVCLFAIPHALALGPLPWLMMSEIFPTRIRAKAVAITTTIIWTAGFSGAMLLPIITEYSEKVIGSAAGLFWMYTVICIFALIFGITLLPETKGKTLEEIAAGWKKS